MWGNLEMEGATSKGSHQYCGATLSGWVSSLISSLLMVAGMAAIQVLCSGLVSSNALASSLTHRPAAFPPGQGVPPLLPSSLSLSNSPRPASPASCGPGTQVSGIGPVDLLLRSN